MDRLTEESENLPSVRMPHCQGNASASDIRRFTKLMGSPQNQISSQPICDIHACMSTCGLVFRCLCLCLCSFETGNCGAKKTKKKHFSRSCARRPLTTDRPQSERSFTAACTVKQERFQLTGNRVVTSPVAKDTWNKMDRVAIVFARIHTHPCMHVRAHVHGFHLAHRCPPVAVCTQSNTAARANTSYSVLLRQCKVFISSPVLFIPCIISSLYR